MNVNSPIYDLVFSWIFSYIYLFSSQFITIQIIYNSKWEIHIKDKFIRVGFYQPLVHRYILP